MMIVEQLDRRRHHLENVRAERVAPDETVTVILLSLSCLLSLYCPAYCHLLSSTFAIVIMVNPCQPFPPAVTISKYYGKLVTLRHPMVKPYPSKSRKRCNQRVGVTSVHYMYGPPPKRVILVTVHDDDDGLYMSL